MNSILDFTTKCTTGYLFLKLSLGHGIEYIIMIDTEDDKLGNAVSHQFSKWFYMTSACMLSFY